MKAKMKIGFRWVAMSVLAAFASLIVWTVWSLLYPYDILKVKPGSWTVANPGKRVARGEPLWLWVDYCVKRHEPARVETAIEQEGRLMYLKPQFPAPTQGCDKKTISLATIPRVLAIESTTAAGTGKARLQITIRYHVNTLREVTYNFYSDEFIIDP